MIIGLGERLKICRNKLKLTRKQVAEILGVSVSVIGFYENDIKQPSLPKLVKLSALYKVSTDYLLGVPADNSRSLSLENLSKKEEEMIRYLVGVMEKN